MSFLVFSWSFIGIYKVFFCMTDLLLVQSSKLGFIDGMKALLGKGVKVNVTDISVS